MKKLALDLDNLHVESFRTSPDAGILRGTVRGHDYSAFNCLTEIGNEVGGADTKSKYWACDPPPTRYDPSCGGTCGGATCAQICIPL